MADGKKKLKVPAKFLGEIRAIENQAQRLVKNQGQYPNSAELAYHCFAYAAEKGLKILEGPQEFGLEFTSEEAEGCQVYLKGIYRRLSKLRDLIKSKSDLLDENKPIRLDFLQKTGFEIFENLMGRMEAGESLGAADANQCLTASVFIEVGSSSLDEQRRASAMQMADFCKQKSREIRENKAGARASPDPSNSVPPKPASPVAQNKPSFTEAPDLPSVPTVPKGRGPLNNLLSSPRNGRASSASSDADDDDEDDGPAPMFGSIPMNRQLSYRGREVAHMIAAVKESKPVTLLEAEGFTRKAVADLQTSRHSEAAEGVVKALKIIENGKGPRYRVANDIYINAQGMSDVAEYLLFAARTLETAGELMTVQQAKEHSAQLLHKGLEILLQ